jgi:hypothetical protein
MNFFLQIGHLVSFPTFTMILSLITLLNTNLIYLRLEGTLSDLILFQHSELLTIRRIENYVKVESTTLALLHPTW